MPSKWGASSVPCFPTTYADVMATPESIRETYKRNAKAIALRPSVGKGTGRTTVSLRDGTTCEVENGPWSFTTDVGTEQGGNDEGPGPGVLERAALGSCLAMGYAQWAALLYVPIEHIEVEVESEFDARGTFGIGDQPPGFTSIRYRVTVESPAPEEDVQEVIDKAEAHSPVLDDFTRPLPVDREVQIVTPSE